MPTILIWRLGALGDTLLLLPALAALRAAYPTDRIVAAGNPGSLAPALWSALVDDVVDAADPRLASLSAGDAPMPGVLPATIDVAVAWSARRAQMARGLEQAGARRVLVAPILPPDGSPVAAHYLATLAPLGVAPVPFTLRAPAPAVEATRLSWNHVTANPAGPVALLHPGTGSRLKQWPLGNYLSLAAALRADGVAVAWTVGPADDDVRAALAAAGESPHVLPGAGVAGLAAYLTRVAVVVSGDCGVAHLAALLGVPTVTLFGPTDHHMWGPPGKRSVVLRLALPCSPCGEVARRCPSRICLRGLPIEAVYAAVHSVGSESFLPTAYCLLPTDMGQCPAPYAPAECHPPRPAPGPPAPLQVSSWAGGRRWGARPWSEEE